MAERTPRWGIAALGAALLLVSIPTAWGDDQGIVYGARPAKHGDAERPSAYFSHALEPGATAVDAVQIYNFSYTPISVLVYAADVVTSPEGRSDPALRGADATGAGTWLEPEAGLVEVAPRGSALVPFTISVPWDTVPDSYSAAILVERDAASSGSGGIQARTRISLRVDVEVLGEIDLGASLADLTWTRERDGIRFELIATNTGTVSFTANGTVEVRRPEGGPVVTLPMTPTGRAVGPGEEIGLEALWSDPPTFGHFEAQPLVTATVSGRIPREYTGKALRFWLVPWGAVIGAAAAVALLTGLFLVSRPRLGAWIRFRREVRQAVRELRNNRFEPPRQPTPTGSSRR